MSRSARTFWLGFGLLAVLGSVGAYALSTFDRDPGTARPPVPHEIGEPRIRVEVLNAAGRAGLARDATRQLRDRGFDVVYYGNADPFGRDSSVVLARLGDLDAARAVAEALGIPSVVDDPDATRLLDVTVLLGLDWTPEPVEPEPGRAARFKGLWR